MRTYVNLGAMQYMLCTTFPSPYFSLKRILRHRMFVEPSRKAVVQFDVGDETGRCFDALGTRKLILTFLETTNPVLKANDLWFWKTKVIFAINKYLQEKKCRRVVTTSVHGNCTNLRAVHIFCRSVNLYQKSIQKPVRESRNKAVCNHGCRNMVNDDVLSSCFKLFQSSLDCGSVSFPCVHISIVHPIFYNMTNLRNRL